VANVDIGIDRIEIATGLIRPIVMGTVNVFSGTLWNGIRLHQGKDGPSAHPSRRQPCCAARQPRRRVYLTA